MVTGVSSPPATTNLRGRMLAATRTPLTASGSAPGNTVLIARMIARSGLNSDALRPPPPAPSALALIRSGGTEILQLEHATMPTRNEARTHRVSTQDPSS